MVTGASQGICPQCGMIHPPIDGDCPMKAEKTESGIEVDYNIFFNPMKQILHSQIKMKDIKDIDKMFKHMVVECTKIAEAYRE